MRKLLKNRFIPLILTLCLLLILAVFIERWANSSTAVFIPPQTGTAVPASTLPLATAVINFSLDPVDIQNGDKFIVNVLIDSPSACRGAQWSLHFKPGEMRCDSVDEGGFFKDWAKANDGATIIFPQPKIDNASGNISEMGITIIGQKEGGAQGAGLLEVYHFTALADHITIPTADNFRIADARGNMIKVTVNTSK
jgi:hypothetical protein